MFEENIHLGISHIHSHDVLLQRRGGHVWMHAGEIVVRVQLRNELAIRGKKHHLHGVLPLGRQVLRQLVAPGSQLLDIIDDGAGANKTSVEPMSDFRVGEQTCSQVGAAGSAALVFE